MQIVLKILIAISACAALAIGTWGFFLGMAFSAHPIKGDPAAPLWQNLRVGITWGVFLAALPALIAIVLACLHRWTKRRERTLSVE